MEIRTQIYKERNVRVHRVTGPLDVDELKEDLAAFYMSPEYRPDMNSIWDLRDADFSSVTTEDIHSSRDLVKKFWGQKGKTKAALVVSKQLDFSLTKMYEILIGGVTSGNVMVFKKYDEAEKWLEEGDIL